jgi:hypothetical protein
MWLIALAPAAYASPAATAAVLPSTTTTTIPKPAVTLVGPTSETIELVRLGGRSKTYKGSIDLLVQNSGADIAQARLSILGDPTASGGRLRLTGSRQPFSLPGFSVTERQVPFSDADAADNNVTIAVTVLHPTGVAPVTETFKLLREPSTIYFWFPIIVGLVFGSVFFLVRGGRWFNKLRKSKKKSAWTLLRHPVTNSGRSVYPPSSWTFGGSWVTLISVLGALVATVLATSGLVTDVFPSFDVQRFVALNLVLGGAVLTGPLIYAALSKVEEADLPRDARGQVTQGRVINGRVIGLLSAASVTLVGVAGQLATLLVLAHISNAQQHEKWGIYAAIAITGLILFIYAYRSVDQLARLMKPPPGSSTQKSFVTGV